MCVCNSAPSVMLKSPGFLQCDGERRGILFSVHAKVSVHQSNDNMKISRQHDSHGSTLLQPQQFPLSMFVVFTALYTGKGKKKKEKPLHGKKMNRPEKVLNNNSGGWKTAAFLQTSYVDDELLLIKTSPVDLMQLGLKKVYFPEAPESTEKTHKEKQNPKK